MCLVWMMTNFKLRNAFNRCYASLPLPIWSFLSPMKSAIKKSWFRRYFTPLTKIWGVTRLSQISEVSRDYHKKEWHLGTDHLTWRGGIMVFCFVQNYFSANTRVRIFFFCRAKREFFFQNSTLGDMTKTLNQIIFSFLHQNQNIFFSNIGNQNTFLEKKNITPLPFKLNGRSLMDSEISIQSKLMKNFQILNMHIHWLVFTMNTSKVCTC